MSNSFKKMAFKIESHEQSAELQRILFEQGYEWRSGVTEIQYTDFTYLNTNFWGYNDITCSEDYKTNYQEMDTQQYIDDYKLSKGQSICPPDPNMTAKNFLTKALKHMEDRAATYDSPEGERSMGKAVHAFNIITGHSLLESEGWLLLQILKDTRQWSKEEFHLDSAEDCVAYAALKGEALVRESKEKTNV